MTTEGEQQEAVCGTCGFPTSDLIHDPSVQDIGGQPAHIPAPVVPSDDEARFRCAGCGVWLRDADLISTSGKGGRRDAHLIAGSVPDYCGPVNEVAPAPPTPSQGAEGDHEIEGFHWIDTECCVTCDEPVVHIEGRGWVHLSRVESAIREHYEELVKAAREPHVLFLCSQAECTEYGTWSAFDGEDTDYQCQHHATARPEWWTTDDDGEWQTGYEPDEDVIRFVSILTRIDESLGGRKDG